MRDVAAIASCTRLALMVVVALGGAPVLSGAQSPPASSAAASMAAYDKGEALAAEGKLVEARGIFEAAARAYPHDEALAAAAVMFRDLEAKRVSGDVVRLIFRAFQHANAGQWAQAHASADQAEKLAPRYARAFAVRGTILLLEDKLADALKAFDRVVQIDAKFAEGYFNRASVYGLMGEYDDAVRDYTRAIELQPDFASAYSNRGTALLNRAQSGKSVDDVSAALRDYAKAHELLPSSAEPLFLRGILYAITEQWRNAEADFTAAIARDAAHAAAYYNRGLAFQNQGNDTRALADYSKAIALDPADPAPLINRGLLFAKQKQFDRAIGDYDKASAVAPALLNSHFNKAQALEQLGRLQDAAAEYRMVLQKAGAADSALVRQARQRLSAIQKPVQDATTCLSA